MDGFGTYQTNHGYYIKKLKKQDIEKMKKIMRRVPILKKKNDEHHQKEIEEAENVFEKQIDSINN